MATLELREVSVRFGALAAVDAVSLSVHAGEIVGLIGPNGAGKTVTFNVVTGLQRPSHGQVFLHGRDVTHAPAHARAAAGLGRTFQVVQLFSGLSVLDNLAVAAHLHTRAGVLVDALRLPQRARALAEARERALAVLDFVGLAALSKAPAESLPVGQARLVELGRALALQPDVLLLDEPASGLDPAETHDFVQLLARVRAVLGVGMLLVEHDMGVVMPLCDHVVVMNGGRVLAAGPPAQVRHDPAVLEAYLGTPEPDEVTAQVLAGPA
jgi:branched-chain amino acid transport system ATP-binding protein